MFDKSPQKSTRQASHESGPTAELHKRERVQGKTLHRKSARKIGKSARKISSEYYPKGQSFKSCSFYPWLLKLVKPKVYRLKYEYLILFATFKKFNRVILLSHIILNMLRYISLNFESKFGIYCKILIPFQPPCSVFNHRVVFASKIPTISRM